PGGKYLYRKALVEMLQRYNCFKPPSSPPTAFSELLRFAALPAALSFRFGLFAAFGGTDLSFATAHFFRCASAIALRPAALIPRCMPPVGCSVGAELSEAKESMARNSASCASLCCF